MCPVNLNALMVGLKFQTMTVWSSPPEAICFIVGLKATALTPFMWPLKVLSSVGSASTLIICYETLAGNFESELRREMKLVSEQWRRRSLPASDEMKVPNEPRKCRLISYKGYTLTSLIDWNDI